MLHIPKEVDDGFCGFGLYSTWVKQILTQLRFLGRPDTDTQLSERGKEILMHAASGRIVR